MGVPFLPLCVVGDDVGFEQANGKASAQNPLRAAKKYPEDKTISAATKDTEEGRETGRRCLSNML